LLVERLRADCIELERCGRMSNRPLCDQWTKLGERALALTFELSVSPESDLLDRPSLLHELDRIQERAQDWASGRFFSARTHPLFIPDGRPSEVAPGPWVKVTSAKASISPWRHERWLTQIRNALRLEVIAAFGECEDAHALVESTLKRWRAFGIAP